MHFDFNFFKIFMFLLFMKPFIYLFINWQLLDTFFKKNKDIPLFLKDTNLFLDTCPGQKLKKGGKKIMHMK